MDSELEELRTGIVDAALRADPERSHRGEATLSIETLGDGALCLEELAAAHPGEFFRLIRSLTPRQRDAVVPTYILGHPQYRIGFVLDVAQSAIERHLMKAMERLQGGTRKSQRVIYETSHRIDSDALGSFRVPVEDAEAVFGGRSSRIFVET